VGRFAALLAVALRPPVWEAALVRGDGLETPVVGVYQLRTGKLARVQMIYFDTAAVNDFLARANSQ
jgi:hypothetical protein